MSYQCASLSSKPRSDDVPAQRGVMAAAEQRANEASTAPEEYDTGGASGDNTILLNLERRFSSFDRQYIHKVPTSLLM